MTNEVRPILFPFKKRKAKQQELLGISLQSDGVAVARINADTQPPQLLGCRFVPLTAGLTPVQALERLMKQQPLGNTDAVLVLEKADFVLQTMESPQVEAAEKVQAIRWKLKDTIDFDVSEAIIDLFDVPQPAGSSRQAMVYVVAAHRPVLQQKTTPLLEHDIRLSAIDIPELAQRNIAALLPEDKQGVALLALSSDSGLLTLTCDVTLYLSRQLELGYRQLTPAPSVADSDMSMVGLSPDMQRAMDQIVLEVQRSLDYYESHFGLAPITSLVIAPLAVEVPGLLQYIASQLGVQVRMLDISSVLDTREPIAREQQAACWTALGAALRQDEAGPA
ncbi:MAG: hypothetical protein R6X06_10260 [Gammaproteobacteria bacterium]